MGNAFSAQADDPSALHYNPAGMTQLHGVEVMTGVLLSGGFETWTIPPESDPVSFTPRVRQPVIMVNGREDFDLPYESAQVPMFKMLGTPAADKAHVVLEGGHLPPKPQDVCTSVTSATTRNSADPTPGISLMRGAIESGARLSCANTSAKR